MQLNHFLQIILDEIAAEGLEGTTLECLWEYLLAFNYFRFMDDLYKEYLWKFIRNFTQVNFYLLEEARECNFQYQNRNFQYNFDKESFVEINIPMFQMHEYQLIPTAFGSCTSYNTRILIDDEIKNNVNCTYTEVMEKYGNRLIIVATEKYRLEFLGLKNIEQCFEKSTFAMLELVGRSRYNGIKSAGSFSCLEYLKNARHVWYLKKKLKSHGLIKVQKVNFLQKNSVKEITVFQTNRFYKPLYNFFEQNMMKMLIYMTSIHSVGLLKSTFMEILELSEDFLNKAKKTRWVEIITTTYRKLNESCDVDVYYTDEELLKFYFEDFRFPKTILKDPLLLIDESVCYIKPIKTLNILMEKIDLMVIMFETDIEPVPDVSLYINNLQLNLEEPLHIQLLKQLAMQPMNPHEIKSTFNINKKDLRALLKMLTKNNEIVVNYRIIDRNTVPYYSINQKLIPQSNNMVANDTDIKQPSKESVDNSSRHTLVKYINPLEISLVNRNPRRQERYDYLVDLIRTHTIIPGHSFAQKFIRDWEANRNLKEIMDRKSYHRILNEAIENKDIKVIEVDFTVYDTIICEKWLVKPGLSRDDQIYKEKFTEHQNQLSARKMESKIKLIKRSPRSRNRKSCNLINYTPSINVIKKVKAIPYEDKAIDFKIPELPGMIRRKIFHEFIWYISVGNHQESNINIQDKVDENKFRIYFDSFDWRRHVAPLQEDVTEKFITFNLNDILSRLPLCLFCILIVPRICNQELYDCLLNEKLRWATLENLLNTNLSLVSFLLNYKKRFGIRRILELLESLLDMGLITRRDNPRPIIFKENFSFFLNKEVFLTDTSKATLPLSNELIWNKFPRYQWLLKSKRDVINFWENIYNVCTNTSCVSLAFRSSGLLIASNGFSEFMRNNEFIAETVLFHGPLSLDVAENIKQFGSWLPHSSIRWKNLGPGGFYRSLTSWNILSWCQNKFDKLCDDIVQPIGSIFKQFRITLFSATADEMHSYDHITSLNENLSSILNEVNIFLIAATLLHYEDKLDEFWQKIRTKNWFKTSFKNICKNVSVFQTLARYIPMLSSDHEKERNSLISSHNETFKKILNVKEFYECSPAKENYLIQLIVLNLFKNHSFIPQWNTMNTNTNEYVDNIPQNQPVVKNEESESHFVDVMKINKTNEDTKRKILPDKIDVVSDIIELQLAKYFIGCMHSYKEHITPDIISRNRILKRYSYSHLITVINKFNNFYTLEPLKLNPKLCHNIIVSGSLDKRLSKFEMRLLNRGTSESSHEQFLRTYCDWTIPPNANSEKKDGNFDLKFDLIECKPTDVMKLIGITFGMQIQTQDELKNSLTLNLNKNNFLFNDLNYNSKSVCQSSLSKVNLKSKNLALMDWDSLTKDANFTINFTDSTYSHLYRQVSHNEVWIEASKFIYIEENQINPPKRRKTRSCTEVCETSIDRINEFINDGMYCGRTYPELKKKFSSVSTLVNDLKQLIETNQVYLLGTNTYHFVSHQFIKCWLIKIPSSEQNSEDSTSTNRKRNKSSTSDKSKTYFFPEFYRDEVGNFKCLTYAEIINRIYLSAYKNTGCSLKFLISDLSILLGEVAVLKLVNVLVEYEVLELRPLKITGKCDPFTKRFDYEEPEYDPFEQKIHVTVVVNPLSHWKMSNLLSEMKAFFKVDLQNLTNKCANSENTNDLS